MNHEQNRAALIREREARAIAYREALAERDTLALAAAQPDALEYDRSALRRAEGRLAGALTKMKHWGDPLPTMPNSAAPSPFTGAAEVTRDEEAEIAAIVARICASNDPVPPRALDPEVEAVAARICASDDAEDEVEAIARRIREA